MKDLGDRGETASVAVLQKVMGRHGFPNWGKFSMTARVAPVALRRVVRPGLPLACLAEGVVGDGMNRSGRCLDVALVFELVGGALAGRDIAALADIHRLVDGAALLMRI